MLTYLYKYYVCCVNIIGVFFISTSHFDSMYCKNVCMYRSCYAVTEGTACFLHFPRFSTSYRGRVFFNSQRGIACFPSRNTLCSLSCYSYLFVYSNVQHILWCVFCFVWLPLVSRVPNAISLFGLYILVLAVFPCCYRFTWSYEEFLPHLIRYLFFSKTLENVDIESYLL